MKGKWTLLGSVLAMLLLAVSLARAQEFRPPGGVGIQAAPGTAFTFSLYDADSGSPPIGVQTTTSITVTNGLLTVPLDASAGAFRGDARWLEIAVKCAGDTSYTTPYPATGAHRGAARSFQQSHPVERPERGAHWLRRQRR